MTFRRLSVASLRHRRPVGRLPQRGGGHRSAEFGKLLGFLFSQRLELRDGPGGPFQFSETPCEINADAPELGQHTEEIMLENGYTWEEIAQMKDEEVI